MALATRAATQKSAAAATAMKARVMKKAKKMKSKIAKGRLAKSLVLRGARERTSGGLSKNDVVKNSRGRVVSKRKMAQARKRYEGSSIQAWVKALVTARKSLGLAGFVAIGGSSVEGKALYAKAKAICTRIA